jgi:GNAT acetyltransferase-like protein
LGADSFQVEPLPRRDWGTWEQLLGRCPQANPFCLPEWLEPLAQVTGAEVEVAICRRGEEPVAGYTAFVHQGPLGRTARLAPTTPYNGVAIVPRACREPHRVERFELDVLRAIRRHATERYDYVRFVHHPALRDVRAFEWDEWRTAVFYTHRLRFEGSEDPVSRVAADVLRRAGLAHRSSIRVEVETRVDEFYTLLAKTHVRQGLRLQLPQKAYFHLFRHLLGRGMLEVRLARSSSGDPLAGNLIVRDGGTAYLWMAAADPAHYSTGGNQLLLVETIRQLSREVKTFDLCGAFCPSVAQYKAAAGGELTPYYTVWRASGRRARCAAAAKDLLTGLGVRRGGFW